MRADRLLSILMLLQSRGRIAAPQLAKELEVSVRTIYRDIDALSTAGVPVYTEQGPGGGCVLVEGYRTSLTGLTRDEVKALFMLSVPASLDKLGVSRELRTAMRKLAAALPSTQRQDEVMVRQRVYLDWTDWSRDEGSIPHLQTIHRAVWGNFKLRLIYSEIIGRGTIEQFERLVDPYGLVAKTGEWYMVCGCDELTRVHSLSSIVQAEITNEQFQRREDFDLIEYWKLWCARREQNLTSYPVTARISPELATLMSLHFGGRFRDAVTMASPSDAAGWLTAVLPFETFDDARKQILDFGRAIEVLEPEPLRLSVIDFARQIVDLYSSL